MYDVQCAKQAHLLHEQINLILRHRDSCRVLHRILHIARLHIEICELLLELVHDRADLLQIHSAHCNVHALDNLAHASRDRAHRHSSLHSRRDGVYPRREPEQVQALVLFADSICGIDLCAVIIAFSESFLELVYFLLLVLCCLG